MSFPWVPFLVAGLTSLGVLAALARRRARRRFLMIPPHRRGLFRRLGKITPGDFLTLTGPVVSGHPGRDVLRITLGEGSEAVPALLKREKRIGWGVRLANALAGFGFASRSLREALALEAARREGIPCPEWLAAGEDGQGRAFLLVREEVGACDLRAYLRDTSDPARRLWLARRLGKTLARLHAAGFVHHDLYANHVLIRPNGGVVLLDWQRARRGSGPPRGRLRDLAALHATLAGPLADCRERVACLRAYLRAETFLSAVDGKVEVRAAVKVVRSRARRLLTRRHVREKRQPALAPGTQGWTCVDGEALCVTPAWEQACPGETPAWLSPDGQPLPSGQESARRWLTLPDGGRALLVRRRSRPAWRKGSTEEQRQAVVLLRLQRHGVPAPAVLALGQRAHSSREVDSFLLTEPAPDTVSLAAWLTRLSGRSDPAARKERRRLLREAGSLLRRLHGAGCHLRDDPLHALAVETSGGKQGVVLDDAGLVVACRGTPGRRARHDRRAFHKGVLALGAGRAEVCAFSRGYRDGAEGPRPSGPPLRGGMKNRDGVAGHSSPAGHPGEAPAVSLAQQGPGGWWEFLVRGVSRTWQRPDWERFVGPGWAECIMDVRATQCIHAKQGRATCRWELGGGLVVYLKRHYRFSWPLRLGLLLWLRADWSPGAQEWRSLVWARRQGLPVPEPVAVAEFLGPWGRSQSCLAVEELPGMLPLNRAIPLAAERLGPAAFRAWKKGLIAEVARLARRLHDRRHFHKDLYLCHLFIREEDVTVAPEEGWRERVALIDLHRLARHAWTGPLWRMKDLGQLLFSSDVPGVTPRDRVAFWRAYRGPGPRPAWERWFCKGIALKAARYRQHNARRAEPAGNLGCISGRDRR
jgi:tRNA A-37 threonylcarbamoyl transferase component Bud32